MHLDLISDLKTIALSWGETKQFVEHVIAFSLDAVHVIGGVLVLLAASLLLRKPVSSMQPWVVVLVLACINELIDLWIDQWPSPGMQYGEGVKDLLLTMLLPTVLFLTSRSFPQLFSVRSDSAFGDQSQPPD